MRLIELFINAQAVDLPATTKGLVKFSQARAALSDVAARVGEFSFPFTLPPTRRNAAVFGVDKLHPLGLNKFGYYTDYAYELRTEGRVFAGTFRLTSLKNGYTGTLLGEGLSWALLLGDSKLTDLEFAPIDYDGTQLEYIMGKDCDATDVQFPLIAWSNFFTPPTKRTLADGSSEEVPAPPAAVLDYPLSVDDYPPGVYYSNVLRQIFRGIGWQLQSRELDSDFWRSVVHTCAGANLEKAWPWGSLLRAVGSGAGRAFSYFGARYENTAVGFYEFDPASYSLPGDAFFLPVPLGSQQAATRALDLATSTYTAPRNGTYSFTWSATVANAYQTMSGPNISQNDPFVNALLNPLGLGLIARRRGQDFTDADGGLLQMTNGQTGNFAPGQNRVLTPTILHGSAPATIRRGTFTGTTSVYLEAGDSLTLATFARRYVMDGKGQRLGFRLEFWIDFTNCSFACTGYADDAGVSKTQLQPADFLPPLGQKDVVRDFLQRTDSFLIPDTSRRVATILTRAELSAAAGPPVDLSERCDLRAVEYLPALGAGVGNFVFAPADNSDEPLTIPSDVVRAVVGAGDGAQTIGSLYAPVGFRNVYFATGQSPALPTCSTKEILAQNRSETQPEISSQPPRLVRFLGPDAGAPVPFMQRFIGLGRAAWDGVLCWDGAAGAVAGYYQPTIRRALRGHLARVQLPITPELYQSLGPGRKVLLGGATYTTEAVSNWDAADEGGPTQVDLSREVL